MQARSGRDGKENNLRIPTHFASNVRLSFSHQILHFLGGMRAAQQPTYGLVIWPVAGKERLHQFALLQTASMRAFNTCMHSNTRFNDQNDFQEGAIESHA